MVFMPYLSRVRRKEFSIEIRKICFLQNSLELHQPNMHIDYRVIPKSVHILSLARISWILTHCFATILLLQVFQLTCEISLRFRVYNQHVIACGTCKGRGLHEE